MGTVKTVTISTDGLRDFVTLPDGLKVMVGQVGMAKLVSECCRNGREARRALNEYLKTGEAMIPLDLDRLAELTAPPKVRWGSDSPLVAVQDRASTTGSGRPGVMANEVSQADKAQQQAISNLVGRIEQQIALISSHASEASHGSIGQDIQKDEVAKLRDLAAWLRRGSPYGDQSKNNTYYGLPEQMVGGSAKQASYQLVSENTLLADATLSRLESTSNKIDLLVTAGKKFDSARAKGDLLKVANAVKDVVAGNIATPAATRELTKLDVEAKRLHGVFAPAKV